MQNEIIVTTESWWKVVIIQNYTDWVAFKNCRVKVKVLLPFTLSRTVAMYLPHSAENSNSLDYEDKEESMNSALRATLFYLVFVFLFFFFFLFFNALLSLSWWCNDQTN